MKMKTYIHDSCLGFCYFLRFFMLSSVLVGGDGVTGSAALLRAKDKTAHREIYGLLRLVVLLFVLVRSERLRKKLIDCCFDIIVLSPPVLYGDANILGYN